MPSNSLIPPRPGELTPALNPALPVRQAQRGMHVDGAADYTARREAVIEALHRLPTYVGMTVQQRTRDACRDVAVKLKVVHCALCAC